MALPSHSHWCSRSGLNADEPKASVLVVDTDEGALVLVKAQIRFSGAADIVNTLKPVMHPDKHAAPLLIAKARRPGELEADVNLDILLNRLRVVLQKKPEIQVIRVNVNLHIQLDWRTGQGAALQGLACVGDLPPHLRFCQANQQCGHAQHIG